MKRTILFFLLAALVLTAAGCAGKPEAAAGPDASSPPEGAVFENQGRKLRRAQRRREYRRGLAVRDLPRGRAAPS